MIKTLVTGLVALASQGVFASDFCRDSVGEIAASIASASFEEVHSVAPFDPTKAGVIVSGSGTSNGDYLYNVIFTHVKSRHKESINVVFRCDPHTKQVEGLWVNTTSEKGFETFPAITR